MLGVDLSPEYTAASRYPRRWTAAVVMMIAALMDMIDATIVNVALPTIRRDLSASGSELEWMVSAYMLAFAATLITAGSMGDRFGRKRLFLLGIAGFGLASLGAGLAHTPLQLIACRAIQGAGAGTMTPQVLATFRAVFRPAERGKAFGIYGAVLGFASAVGLILGGVLTQANIFGWGWRAIFFVNLPVALFSLASVWVVVPETRDGRPRRPDLAGAALLAAALVAVVYALLEGRQQGWPLWIWLLLGAGLLALAGLGLLEARRWDPDLMPLLRPQLLRVPAFSAGLGVQLLFSAGMQGFSLVLVLWLQSGQRFTPLHAGLTMVAFSVGSFFVAPFAVPLAERRGRLVLAGGGVLMAAGVAVVAGSAGAVGIDSNVWPLVPGLVAAGAGLAFLVIPLVNVVLAAAPAEAAGSASGLFGTVQQLGGALGVAVVGTVFFGDLPGNSLRTAFVHAVPVALATFAGCALLSLVLPDRAVPEEYVATVLGGEEQQAS